MQTKPELPFFTLLLMISFASVNAVLFTPALPNIATYFNIPSDTAQQTITFFLVGYALGQLLYGPLANRYGRKPALYAGIILQIISCLLCVFSGILHKYSLMVLGRFLLALGSGVGLKMTFTLVNECYESKIASQKIAYLMLGFAVTPGLAVALGGFLTPLYGWESCFYAGAVYGVLLLLMVSKLPETLNPDNRDLDALKIKHLISNYISVFNNSGLIAGGLIMGGSTCFIYIFAAVAPFVAMDIFGMSSQQYGLANILPPAGLILGSLLSAKLAKQYPLASIIKSGIIIASVGAVLMLITVVAKLPPVLSLFIPMIVVYFGLSLILANASSVAMSHVSDKAHGSAVMNFINMGLATLVVLSLGYFPVSAILLPAVYLGLCLFMMSVYIWLTSNKTTSYA